MTLKTRNALSFITAIISTAIFLFSVLLLTVAAITHKITPPDNPVRIYSIFSNMKLFTYNFYSVLAVIFFFALYVPVLSFVIFTQFEKTPSLEILFFNTFLIGCLCEVARVIVPVFDIYSSYSQALIISGRIVMAGRVLAPLSMFFSFAFSNLDERQNAERNLIILYVVSILIGMLFPLDTKYTTTTCTVLWSFRTVFFALRIFLFLAPLSIMIVDICYKKNSDLKDVFIGFILLNIGYYILCESDCFVALVFGIGLLSSGTILYLKSIHKASMWR